MQMGPKLDPLQDFGVAIIILSKHEMAYFGKNVPQKSLFWKKLLFDLLDHWVDTLSIILS